MTVRRLRSLASPSGVTYLASGMLSSLRVLRALLNNKPSRLDITTNQPATQVYTAYWLNTPRKVVHGGPTLNYTSFSAVAIEQEGYIDAINTPEWNVDQIC